MPGPVTNAQLELTAAFRGPDHDLGAGRRELDGVSYEVDERLDQSVAVSSNSRQEVGCLDAEPHAVVAGEGFELLQGAPDGNHRVDSVPFHREAAGIDAGEVEQVLDESVQEMHRLLDGCQVLVAMPIALSGFRRSCETTPRISSRCRTAARTWA
jgi:hypothetical protein